MEPTVPSSLPNYLAEGLPKQDDETLREVQEYVDEFLVRVGVVGTSFDRRLSSGRTVQDGCRSFT